jgi:hypothetical protein
MIKRSYMNIGDSGKVKNKAKTKPIKANLSQFKPNFKPILVKTNPNQSQFSTDSRPKTQVYFLE